MANNTNEDEGWLDASAGKTDGTWDKSAPIMGKYVRKQENVGPNNSNMYHIEITEGDDQGKTIGVWGSTVLDTKFDSVPVNSLVKVEALGKTKSEKTGREYEDFKLLYKPPVPEEIEKHFPGAEPA